MSTVDPAGTHKPKQPKKWQIKIAEYWKAIFAAGGALLILLNVLVGLNFWGERTLDWINAGIAGLAALGVVLKSNQAAVEKLTGIDIDEDKKEG